ncbi:MAG: outer membrane lipoprotein chaperone LolA [Burkholderiales bacterium]
MKKHRLCALLLVLTALPACALAGGLEALDGFMRGVKSARADFTQVVTAPLRQGEATARSKISTGTFEFQRPNRFRFVYKKPFEQSIVSDGQTLWLHDVDLNQVSTRPLGQALQGTPAVILSATSIAALQASFNLQDAPDKAGLQWVTATPRNKDGPLQAIAVGFKGEQLATLEILDSFGQRSVMSFSQLEVNPALTAGVFSFKPPAGVDVLRQ